jgi:hypothetical protein
VISWLHSPGDAAAVIILVGTVQLNWRLPEPSFCFSFALMGVGDVSIH